MQVRALRLAHRSSGGRSSWGRWVAALLVLAMWPRDGYCAPAAPPAPDRIPIAVLWMGEAEAEIGPRVVEDVNAALTRKLSARPIDSAEDRRLLAEGGPSAKVTAQLRAGEAALARGKLAEAARLFEAAEAQLFAEVPFDSMRGRIAEIERALLLTYDQLGRNADAVRAAARLQMAPGTAEDMRALIERHGGGKTIGAALPPVEIVSQPPGAQVYRNLLPIGVTPLLVDGGAREVDFVDVEAPGYRRAHLALGMGGRTELVLAREDRLSVLVDRIRDQAPDAPPAEVAALGKRVGAGRVLALMPDGSRKVLARWLDVGHGKWSDASLRVDNAGQLAMERLAGYAAPGEPQGNGAGAQLATPPQLAETPTKKKLGIWGKWYTWVAAAGVVALVVGLLVAQNVGDDKLTVTSSH